MIFQPSLGMLKSRMKRLLLIVGGGLVVVLLLATLGLWLYIRAGYPDYDQELALEALSDEVTVYRDNRGVAHIQATSESDLFFAQGYVHAQERLWQMDFHRRVVQGRLSELFGESQLGADQFLRTIGLNRIAERVLEHTSPEGMEVLEQYAAGVNAFLESEGRLPLEFRVLGIEPEPWEPIDSARLVALMGYDLGENWRIEAMRETLRETLPDTLFQDILPPFEQDSPAVWTAEQAQDSLVAQGMRDMLQNSRLGGLDAYLPHLGSNSWVVAPERSASGNALIGNDPHLGLNLPALWYENGLQAGEQLDVYGWSLPGGPGVIIGHNTALAWGFTNTGDTQDLFREEADPADPDRFRYDDEWYEAEVIVEEIRVDGRDEPVEHEVRITRNGPIMEDSPRLSLRWTGYDLERSTIDAVLRMNRATDWASFRVALRDFVFPVQNVVYADTAGNIAYRTVGNVPIRRQGRGLLPQPGEDPAYGWERMIPFDELPELVNPPQGYIATANHRVASDDYPYDIVIDHAPYYRMQRIADVLEVGESHTLDDLQALQTDWLNLHAARRLPQFLSGLEQYRGELGEAAERGVELLHAWSDEPVNRREAAAPAIFQTWYLQLMRAVFEGPMGEAIYRDVAGQRSYLAYNSLEHLLDQGESAWFADGLESLLYQSYLVTIDSLQQRLGGSPDDWRWDQLQSVRFTHVLDESALLRPIVSSGPHPYGGDHMTVGRAAYSLAEPFEVVHGAGVRFVAELAGPVRSRAVLAGGQSGHPLHRHYRDQLEAWLGGTYYDIPQGGHADEQFTHRMTLRPPSE